MWGLKFWGARRGGDPAFGLAVDRRVSVAEDSKLVNHFQELLLRLLDLLEV
jgi:hypothetical protein